MRQVKVHKYMEVDIDRVRLQITYEHVTLNIKNEENGIGTWTVCELKLGQKCGNLNT